ncbi:MAG: hypothetical protein ONB24_01220 [candidate division KSB1 bacterium]|nr:hypothetical protein [candidate division KSB1 bacterium]
MKRMIYVLTIALLTTVAFAADQPTNVEKARIELAKRALLDVLKSENAGARNSALHVIAKIKSDYPDVDLTVFNDMLLKLSRNDERSLIRVNANLAYAYINNPELAARVKVEDPEDPAAFFNALYNELNKAVVAFNN